MNQFGEEVEKRVKFIDTSNGKVLMFTIDGAGVTVRRRL